MFVLKKTVTFGKFMTGFGLGTRLCLALDAGLVGCSVVFCWLFISLIKSELALSARTCLGIFCGASGNTIGCLSCFSVCSGGDCCLLLLTESAGLGAGGAGDGCRIGDSVRSRKSDPGMNCPWWTGIWMPERYKWVGDSVRSAGDSVLKAVGDWRCWFRSGLMKLSGAGDTRGISRLGLLPARFRNCSADEWCGCGVVKLGRKNSSNRDPNGCSRLNRDRFGIDLWAGESIKSFRK